MNIQTNQLDPLNAVISVEINKADYTDSVDKVLNQYKKTANIPGFRKGHVPMGMIVKQYGKAVKFDEVNKLLNDSLNQYIQEQNLNLLGQALPKNNDDFDLDKEDFTFEFEVGLSPKFEVDLSAKNKLVHYQIEPDQKMIDEQVERIQKHYGKIIAQDTIDNDSDIKIKFENQEAEISSEADLKLSDFKSKKVVKDLNGLTIGATLEIATKGLFEDDHKLMEVLKVSHDKAHGLDVSVKATITNITKTEPAELNQELFDKLFPNQEVTSLEALKQKIKDDAVKQFKSIGDNKFINEVNEWLIESTKFDLPNEFLIKWIQNSGEQELTPEQAAEEFEKAEKGIRYQLIEGQLFEKYDLKVSMDDVKAYTFENIKKQMAQFGMMNPTDEEVQNIVNRVLTNQEEVKRVSDEVVVGKISNLFLEQVKAKKQTISYDKFLELTKEN